MFTNIFFKKVKKKILIYSAGLKTTLPVVIFDEIIALIDKWMVRKTWKYDGGNTLLVWDEKGILA